MRWTFLICCLFSLSLSAQEVSAPTLSDLQKSQLQVAYLTYENARLKLDAAQKDLLTLIQSLQRPNYTFDVNSMTYAPIEKK